MSRPCSIEGCDRHPVVARGWCNLHYSRWRRHGDPLAEVEMQLRDMTAEERLWVRVDKRGPDECWEWVGRTTNPKGYGLVWSGTKYLSAHRVSYEIANGPIPDGLLICHHCDNPPCCNPAHLYAGTERDNSRDRMERGRHYYIRGEKTGNSKLTDEAVREIRRRRAAGEGRRPLAEEFGVAVCTITEVTMRRRWAHVA